MTIFDWILITGLSLAMLTFLFSLLFFLLSWQAGSKLKKIQRRRIKNKRKRKMLMIEKRNLQKRKKSRRNNAIFCVIFCLMFGSGVGYLYYYQSTNLMAKDADSIAQGYYLLKDMENELTKAGSKEGSKEKAENNLRVLSGKIASYGAKEASSVNTEEGQLVLNRYYRAMKEFGTNTVSNYISIYGNQKMVDEFKEDIKNVQKYQKKVFAFYKVNEEAFKKK